MHSTEVLIKALLHQAVRATDTAPRPRAVNGAISYMPNIFRVDDGRTYHSNSVNLLKS